jgi:glyoxylase-like metal-dependent hydrolase (beta-lactamase superfamily II)
MVTRRGFLASSAALGAASLLPAQGLAKAPMLGLAPAAFHRYKFGGFEFTALLDGQITLDKPGAIFGEDQKPEVVEALLKANYLPTDKHVITFTPVVINTGKEMVLFDTGWGAAGRPGRGNLKSLLAAAGFTPDQIDVVVITHCHPDHMGGLMEDGKPLCPNARYVIGEAEYNFWSAPAQMAGATEDFAKLVAANVTPLRDKTAFVKGEGEAVPGIRAIETHGHTPGHLSWRIETEGKQLIAGGDFCNHSVLSLQRPDWHVLFDMDKDKAVASRRMMLDMLATDRIPFTSYHMPFPALGYVEKAADGGYRFVPATYQFTL